MSNTVERPYDVSPQVWEDYLVHRKERKASVTKTVLVRIKNEADRAGVSLEEALSVCCANNWQGFKAEWLHQWSTNLKTPQNKQEALEARNKAIAEAFQKKVKGLLNAA